MIRNVSKTTVPDYKLFKQKEDVRIVPNSTVQVKTRNRVLPIHALLKRYKELMEPAKNVQHTPNQILSKVYAKPQRARNHK